MSNVRLQEFIFEPSSVDGYYHGRVLCYTGRKEASIESESVCNLAKHGTTKKRAACRAVIELVRLGRKSGRDLEQEVIRCIGDRIGSLIGCICGRVGFHMW